MRCWGMFSETEDYFVAKNMKAHLETSCLPASFDPLEAEVRVASWFRRCGWNGFTRVAPKMLIYSRVWNDCPPTKCAEEYFSKQTSDNGTYQYLFCVRGVRIKWKFNGREHRIVQCIIYRLEKMFGRFQCLLPTQSSTETTEKGFNAAVCTTHSADTVSRPQVHHKNLSPWLRFIDESPLIMDLLLQSVFGRFHHPAKITRFRSSHDNWHIASTVGMLCCDDGLIGNLWWSDTII